MMKKGMAGNLLLVMTCWWMPKFMRTINSQFRNFTKIFLKFLQVFTKDSDRKTRLPQVLCLLGPKTAYQWPQNKKKKIFVIDFLSHIASPDE